MTASLPPSLLAFFAPRPPIAYLPPIELPKLPPMHGVAQFVAALAEPERPADPNSVDPQLLKARRKEEKLKQHSEGLTKLASEWDPDAYENATRDPYRTLFIGRLSFDTTESKLRREFEQFGPVKKVIIVTDKKGRPRGYAFVEFEHERDMKRAYKEADGRKIDNKRIVVDVERGRTMKTWKPRRLGGGLGNTRAGPNEANQRYSGREPVQSSAPAASSGSSRGPPPRSGGGSGVDRGVPGRPSDRDRGDRDRGDRDRGDRDRDRERERDRDRDRDRERDRDRDRDHRDRDRDRDRERDRDRDRERDSRSRSDRDRERDKDKDKDQDKDRDHRRS